MIAYLRFVLLALAVVTATAQSETVGVGKSEPYNALDQQNADRLLLVAFTDNTIDSLKGTASPTTYRNRGDAYQSSTWSERISDALAEDYNMEKLTEWPMTEVGAHCIVYQVADKVGIGKYH